MEIKWGTQNYECDKKADLQTDTKVEKMIRFLDNSCLITHSFDFCDFEIERYIETLNMKMLYTYMFFHMFYAYLDNGQTFALRGLI